MEVEKAGGMCVLLNIVANGDEEKCDSFLIRNFKTQYSDGTENLWMWVGE